MSHCTETVSIILYPNKTVKSWQPKNFYPYKFEMAFQQSNYEVWKVASVMEIDVRKTMNPVMNNSYRQDVKASGPTINLPCTKNNILPVNP